MIFGKVLIQNTLNRLLNTVVMFLTTVLLTRMIGASGFGVLTLMIANASILNLISSLGVGSGITYNLAAKNLRADKILSITFMLLLAQLFFTTIIDYGWFLQNNSFWLFKGNSLMDFVLGICFFMSLSVIEKYNALFYGRQQFQLANNIALVANFALLFSLLLLSICKVENNFVYFVIYIITNIFQAFVLIITYYLIYRESIKVTLINKKEFQLFFSYSFLAFVTNILQFVAYRADYWLVDYYKGSLQLGLYSVSVRLAQLFWIIPGLFAAIIFPKVASNQIEENSFNLLSLVRIMNTCNIISGLLLFFFSPYLITWLFGIEYADSITPFRILLPGVITFCFSIILASYFAGINKLKVNFYGTVLCLLVIIILDIGFIPSFGIKGAALASSIGYTLMAAYHIIIFKKQTKARFKQLILLKKNDLVYFKRLIKNTARV